jgi:hypothetical protein
MTRFSRAACVVALILFGRSSAIAQAPDVTGVWHIRHSFDLTGALPSETEDVFNPLRMVNQSIVDELELPPKLQWLEPIISAYLEQHPSPWMPTILRIGQDLGVVLNTLRSEGVLQLTKRTDLIHVNGSEVWTSLVFYWLGLCGDNIGGDPRLPPECARFDVFTSDDDVPEEPSQCDGRSIPAVTVKVKPITAEVRQTTSPSGPAWQLAVDPRQVKLDMSDVTLAVVNQLLKKTTPWECIEELSDCKGNDCAVDCSGLGAYVDSVAPGVGPGVKDTCERAVKRAGNDVAHAVDHLTFDTNVLDFNGAATIHQHNANITCSTGVDCADKLGLDDFDARLIKDPAHRDGEWTGSFFSRSIKTMPGAWQGTRNTNANQ